MEKLLLILTTESDGSLSKASREAVTAVTSLGGPFSLALIGADVADAAGALAGAGAEAVYAVAGEEFGQARYATDAAAAAALASASGAAVIVGPATSRLSRVLPGVAARLGGKADTNLTALAVKDGRLVATRWYYRQRMVAELTRSERPWALTIQPGCFAPYEGPAGAAAPTMIEVPVTGAMTRTVVREIVSPAADAQTIRPDAKVLFVAGAGWTKKQADGQPHVPEAGELILGFVGKAQASLGSSKSLVDQGGEGQAVLPFLTHMHQVGQTGATPRHAKGLATCCHGEEPHVVGWRFIGERRAVNLDAGCGWAQGKCDVLYVADAFAVMRAVNALLG